MAKREVFDLEAVEPEYRKCQLPKSGSNIITPLARLSFPNLQKPRPNKKGDAADKKKKYGCSLLIPPGFSLKLLKADIERAADDKWGEKRPKSLKLPFLEAGDFEYEGYERGWTLIRATCDVKPGVIDGLEGVKIVEDDDPAIYPGRWCVASIRAFAYDVDGNRGIAFGLGNVRLLHDDESLGGRVRVEDEFDVAEEYSDMKKGKKKAFEEDEDEDDDRPRRSASKRKPARDEDEEEERPARRSATKRRVVEEDEDDEPRRPAKKTARRVVEEDDEEDERPARRSSTKRRSRDDDENLD